MDSKPFQTWSLDAYLRSLTHYTLGSAQAWAIDSPQYEQFPPLIVAWLRMVAPDYIVQSDDPEVPESDDTSDEEFKAWISERLPWGLQLEDGEVLDEIEGGAGGWMTSSWWLWTARAFTQDLAIVTWWWDDSDPMGLLHPVGFAKRDSLELGMKLLCLHGNHILSYIPDESFDEEFFADVEGAVVTPPTQHD